MAPREFLNSVTLLDFFSETATARCFPKGWADPEVLWKKAPRAMRAMRGKALETVPFQPYFGFAQKASSKYCQTSTAKQREL